MHALKWWKLSTRMWYEGEPAGGTPAAPAGGSGGEAAAPSGGDGGAAAPSGGSSAAPGGATPAPSPAAGEGPPDWSALGSLDDLDHQQEIPAATQPVVQPPVPAAVAPPAQPVAQPVVPQPAVAPVQGQVQAPAQGTGDNRPLSASDPWRIAEGIEANRDAIVAHLAQSKFALSEADIKDLDTDVTVAVPKLLARVYVESQVSMQKFLAQAVPGMMRQFTSVSNANDQAEKMFFAAHRGLDANNPQHRATAVRIATVYRQANPGIPLQQLIAEVGPMVMAALQISAAAQPAAPGGAPARGAAGAFRPAVNGGGGHSPAPQPENEWAGLGRDYD